MKFIIPQNYDFSTKLFGIIDYSTAILNVVWCTFVFCIINFFISSLFIKIFIFIILCFPVLLFIILFIKICLISENIFIQIILFFSAYNDIISHTKVSFLYGGVTL